VSQPLFPPGYRAAGVLLHVTSLPSPYGIGDLGPSAVAWIDRLHESGQTWWQALPLGPTGYGDSPYQALSSFAGNPILMSPDWLIEDELVKRGEVAAGPFPAAAVDFDGVKRFKQALLERAWKSFGAGARSDLRPAFERFSRDQAHWLDDYALFRALKTRYDEAAYLDWPDNLVRRAPAALDQARHELKDQIDRIRFGQFVLFRQGEHLKAHARARGVRLIGDLPFFVSPDSSDVWASPELFLLDAQGRPRVVAGVPPDYFSAQGQLWGNPIYDWAALATRGYSWCIDRLRALLAHVDAVRLDHFRAFVAAWHIPAGAPTAQSGQWVPGPGADFFVAVEKALAGLPFVAEDLGLITPDVIALRDAFGVAGSRVLQFAFDGHSDNPYLPHNYVPNAVVYTGTHDNPPTRGWYEDLPEAERTNLWCYLQRAPGRSEEVAPALLGLAWSSAAALAIAPLQDVLNLGKEARMNQPGSAEGNWRWRCTDEMLSAPGFDSLKNLTRSSARAGAVEA
jgi:4-alpha-glucanotransferase